MDAYQATYDAVRSRISPCDVGHIVERAAQNAFDLGHVRALLQEQIGIVGGDMTAPHVLMRPRVYPDGAEWCALYGDNLQDGVAGFGKTPFAACADFDKNWWKQTLTPAAGTTHDRLAAATAYGEGASESTGGPKNDV